MLSKKLHEALNAQINAEMWSAYLYLSMSMDAEAKGLKGVANWFYVQFREEQDHARILMNYILSRDAEVKLLPIAEVRTSWASPLEMFQDTLGHEKKVTAMINNLAAIAAEDKDYASSNMLVWFVDEQVECKYGRVPLSIVPQQIQAALADLYGDYVVVGIERDRREYEVKLSNRLEVTFNRSTFRIIDIDD